MKVIILTLMACAVFAKATEKHFHYHFDGLDAETQRELMQLDPSHKGFFANVKCFFKNPFNKQKRQDCVAAAKAAENKAAPKSAILAGKRLLEGETDGLFRSLDHKVNWQKAKCYSLYFWSKTKRQACLDKIQRKLMTAFASLGNPQHRGFWGNFKCLMKHAFNKTKRQDCYNAVKAEDDKKKAEAQKNAAAIKPAPKRRLNAEHKQILDKTGCFFKYMFNKKKRAECNAKAKAARDAKNKADAEKKAAQAKADEKKKAEEKKKEKNVGLNSKGKKKVHRHFYF